MGMGGQPVTPQGLRGLSRFCLPGISSSSSDGPLKNTPFLSSAHVPLPDFRCPHLKLSLELLNRGSVSTKGSSLENGSLGKGVRVGVLSDSEINADQDRAKQDSVLISTEARLRVEQVLQHLQSGKPSLNHGNIFLDKSKFHFISRNV